MGHFSHSLWAWTPQFLLPNPRSSFPPVEISLSFLTVRKCKEAISSQGCRPMGQLPETAGKRV